MDTEGELPSVDDFLLVAEIAEAELKQRLSLEAAWRAQQQARKAAEGRRKQSQQNATAKHHVAVTFRVLDEHVKVDLRVLEVCFAFS
jgi:hypothetical protein